MITIGDAIKCLYPERCHESRRSPPQVELRSPEESLPADVRAGRSAAGQENRPAGGGTDDAAKCFDFPSGTARPRCASVVKHLRRIIQA